MKINLNNSDFNSKSSSSSWNGPTKPSFKTLAPHEFVVGVDLGGSTRTEYTLATGYKCRVSDRSDGKYMFMTGKLLKSLSNLVDGKLYSPPKVKEIEEYMEIKEAKDIEKNSLLSEILASIISEFLELKPIDSILMTLVNMLLESNPGFAEAAQNLESMEQKLVLIDMLRSVNKEDAEDELLIKALTIIEHLDYFSSLEFAEHLINEEYSFNIPNGTRGAEEEFRNIFEHLKEEFENTGERRTKVVWFKVKIAINMGEDTLKELNKGSWTPFHMVVNDVTTTEGYIRLPDESKYTKRPKDALLAFVQNSRATQSEKIEETSIEDLTSMLNGLKTLTSQSTSLTNERNTFKRSNKKQSVKSKKRGERFKKQQRAEKAAKKANNAPTIKDLEKVNPNESEDFIDGNESM